jgi:hypothetical protein
MIRKNLWPAFSYSNPYTLADSGFFKGGVKSTVFLVFEDLKSTTKIGVFLTLFFVIFYKFPYFFFRLLREKKKQDDLLDQIDALKQKVASANEGLAAANRLSEQLEKKTQAIAMLKHEVKLREDLLKKAQSQLKDVQSNNTVKVDRYRGGN